MRILIVKLSSIGDLIHTFPAIVDAKLHIQNLIIDWLVDEDFAEIINIYKKFNNCKAIGKIIPIPFRKLKRNLFKELIKYNLRVFFKELRSIKYDLVIDPQGLLKSAILSNLCRTKNVVGFDFNSSREKLASFFYKHKVAVDKNLHAIFRIKKLFANSLNYLYEEDVKKINYGLDVKDFQGLIQYFPKELFNVKYIVLLHGTSWESKLWTIDYWYKLGKLIIEDNNSVVVFVNDDKQRQFAEQFLAFLEYNLSENYNNKLIILNKLSFLNIMVILANARGVVSVDTGFGHLAASMSMPIVGIYGPTSVIKAGILGIKSSSIQSNYHCSPCYSRACLEYLSGRVSIKQPCFLSITPDLVFKNLKELIKN